MIQKSILLTACSLALCLGLHAQNQTMMKNINPKAPVSCSKSIAIHAPKENVWEVLTQINHWPEWQPAIRSPRINGPVAPGTSFDWTTGGAKIHSTLHTVEMYHAFGWTGKTFGMYAIHNWTLTESNGETIVHVDESLEGFLADLFKKSFNTSLEKGMVYWLEMLKKRCESPFANTQP